jgi:hypothetical protein
LASSKQSAQKFDVERLNLRKLNELEVRKQYDIKISNRFAALENIGDGEDINRAWENIKENIQISGKESLYLFELSSINHGLMRNV